MSDTVSFVVHNLWPRGCFGLLVGTLLLLGCRPISPLAEAVEPTQPSELPTATPISATEAATAPPAATLASSPVATVTPGPTALPTLPLTPTPGPELAFYYYRDRQIFRFDLRDGSSQILPLPSTGGIDEPVLSPDGRWLAFRDDEALKLVSLAGAVHWSEPLAEYYQPGHVVFSPESRQLAYTNKEALHLLDLETLADRPLLANDWRGFEEDVTTLVVYSAHSWSADGGWLLVWRGFWEGGELALVEATTGAVSEFLSCMPDVSWAPAGAQFAMAMRYSSYHQCGQADGVYLVEPSSQGVALQALHDAIAEPSEQEWLGPADVAWSPERSLIAFAHVYDTGPHAALHLVAPDGSGLQTVAEAADAEFATPLWLAAASELVFTEWRGDQCILHTYNLDNGEQPLRLVGPDPCRLVAADDDQWLVLTTILPTGRRQLLLLDRFSETQVALDVGHGGFIGWERTVRGD